MLSTRWPVPTAPVRFRASEVGLAGLPGPGLWLSQEAPTAKSSPLKFVFQLQTGGQGSEGDHWIEGICHQVLCWPLSLHYLSTDSSLRGQGCLLTPFAGGKTEVLTSQEVFLRAEWLIRQAIPSDTPSRLTSSDSPSCDLCATCILGPGKVPSRCSLQAFTHTRAPSIPDCRHQRATSFVGTPRGTSILRSRGNSEAYRGQGTSSRSRHWVVTRRRGSRSAVKNPQTCSYSFCAPCPGPGTRGAVATSQQEVNTAE